MYNDGVNPLMIIHQTSAAGKVLLAGFSGVLPTTTPNGFAVGCVLVDEVNKIVYFNNGTSTVPVWSSASNESVQVQGSTIATTSTTTEYVTAPCAGTLQSVFVTPLVALATSDTNYITWTITNLGQAGAGSAAMLATSPAGINTTKATGGTALAINTKYSLPLSATAANLLVAAGDRIQITTTATGTLANTVTKPVYILSIDGSAV